MGRHSFTGVLHAEVRCRLQHGIEPLRASDKPGWPPVEQAEEGLPRLAIGGGVHGE